MSSVDQLDPTGTPDFKSSYQRTQHQKMTVAPPRHLKIDSHKNFIRDSQKEKDLPLRSSCCHQTWKKEN
jgi:hypothetical protein